MKWQDEYRELKVGSLVGYTAKCINTYSYSEVMSKRNGVIISEEPMNREVHWHDGEKTWEYVKNLEVLA